jgi:hypothetical protein
MSPVVWTCKRIHVGAAVGMLVVLLLLPLFFFGNEQWQV